MVECLLKRRNLGRNSATPHPVMHFPVTAFAYAGFKPWADIVPPANKPGETNESRANKFQNVGHGVVYRKGPPCEFPRDSTNFSMSYSNIEPADFKVRHLLFRTSVPRYSTLLSRSGLL